MPVNTRSGARPQSRPGGSSNYRGGGGGSRPSGGTRPPARPTEPAKPKIIELDEAISLRELGEKSVSRRST